MEGNPPSFISSLVNQLERDKEQLGDLKYKRQVLYWEYFKVENQLSFNNVQILSKYMELLAHVLMEFKLKWQYESDKVLHQWLLARFRTMSLKLEYFFSFCNHLLW